MAHIYKKYQLRQWFFFFVTLTFLIWRTSEAAEEEEEPLTHDATTEEKDVDQQESLLVTTYNLGKEAYAQERWSQCIDHMENTLQLFKRHRARVVHCRSKCHREAENETPLLTTTMMVVDNDHPLRFYEKTIRDTLCLMKCRKRDKLDTREAVAAARNVNTEILDRKPYDYLQLCYYKVNELQNAISSAYTFLLQNPDHEVMRSNFRFYTSQKGAQLQHIRNLEAEPYQEFFLKGNDAYNKKAYQEVVVNFEEALDHYYKAEEECRLLCEGHFEKGPTLDLTMTIANHFTYSLRCKQQCPKKLSYIYGEHYEDYLASHYHYLQFAYYQIGQVEKACKAVATHLLFHPNNEVMLHNKEYYLGRLMLTDGQQQDHSKLFTPREEAVSYVRRDTDEKLLLAFIETNFQTLKNNPNHGEGLGYQQDDTEREGPMGPSAQIGGNPVRLSETDSRNISIVMTENELNGKKRFAADGFVDSDECEQLTQLATEAAVHGDGYNGRTSPHTKFETFEGLTIGRAVVLVSLGILNKTRVQLLLDVSDRGRNYIEKYFGVSKGQMYFSYTHLVCRTARPDSPANRSDLSHPVHADNCIMTKDGGCRKEKPAYTWRDYSAIIYLNDDFDGGEFIFAKDKENIQSSVRPKCGRMVGFSAGRENTHGVRAVLKGRRCALAIWFTLDHKHRERERFLAAQVLLNHSDTKNSTSSSTAAAAPTTTKEVNKKKKTIKKSITMVKNDHSSSPATQELMFRTPSKTTPTQSGLQQTDDHYVTNNVYQLERSRGYVDDENSQHTEL